MWLDGSKKKSKIKSVRQRKTNILITVRRTELLDHHVVLMTLKVRVISMLYLLLPNASYMEQKNWIFAIVEENIDFGGYFHCCI